MKVTKTKVNRESVFVKNMPIGTLFEMDYGSTHICLRVHNMFVSLTDPNCTWDLQYNPHAKGQVLPNDESITLQNT